MGDQHSPSQSPNNSICRAPACSHPSRLEFSSWQLPAFAKRRAMDLSKVSADQDAFLAQREDGIKTMKAWYWDVCGKEYDEANA